MKRILLASLLVFSIVISVFAQNKIDTTTVSKIKDEGFNRSQVMDILSMLTDVHGPRLSNSPGYKNAANYAKTQLEKWGLQNVHYDVWDADFGRGWYLKRFSLQNMEPVYFPVIAYPKAWSPGLKGTVKGEAIYLDVTSEEDLQKNKGKLKGNIVLFSLPTPVKPGFEPDASRFDDSALLDMANAGNEEGNRGRRFRGGSEPQRLAYLKWEFCMQEGAVAILEASSSARLEDGTVVVSSATIPYHPDVPFGDRVRAQSGDVFSTCLHKAKLIRR